MPDFIATLTDAERDIYMTAYDAAAAEFEEITRPACACDDATAVYDWEGM